MKTGNNKSYWTTGTEGKSAAITVANGKTKMEVSEVGVTRMDNDNKKLDGTIDEK